VGVAVDLAMMTSKKQNLQDAVDIAALMAIQMPRKSEVRATFKQSLSDQGLERKTDFSIRDFEYKQSDGHVTLDVTVKGKHELMFGDLLDKNRDTFHVNTVVAGAQRISSVKFTPTYGSGFLDKEFQLWVNRPVGPSPEKLATFTWKSSAPIINPDGSSPGRLSSSKRGSVELGDYTDFYITTTIADPWDTYTHEKKVEFYGEDYTVMSSEPGHGYHFFVNDRQLSVGEKVNFARDFSCSNPDQRFEWEDIPGAPDFNTDFRFTVKAKCDEIDPETIRITN
jgi:hypothetical protein